MSDIIFPTPFEKLNGILSGGLRPGGLTVVGARPGMGKKSFTKRLTDKNKAVYIEFDEPKAEGLSKLLISVKEFAKINGAAAVVALKLPRDLEKRIDKRPIPEDFYGLLEKDGFEYVDNIIGLYRASYYDENADGEEFSDGEALILKNAAGPCEKTYMRFEFKTRNWTEKY